jgi:hypothetical protein
MAGRAATIRARLTYAVRRGGPATCRQGHHAEVLLMPSLRSMAIKERALARTTPAGVKLGRYRPTDALLAFLERL